MRLPSSRHLASFVLLVAGFAVTAQASADSIQERLGHPPGARLLMIHADDLGMAQSVNRASLEALENGWITSASVMVPCPWFPEVAHWAREHPETDLGLHLTLNSEWDGYRWGPVSPVDEVASLLDEEGYLPKLTGPMAERARIAEVERELKAQIARAKAAGLQPTHFDNHMRALMETPELVEVYRRLGRENGVPVMLAHGRGLPDGAEVPASEIAVDEILGVPAGLEPEQWDEAYRKMLGALGPGVYILIVHLASDDAEMRAATRGHVDFGAAWRQSDYDLVRDPAFRRFLADEGFVLVGWRDLARALQEAPKRARQRIGAFQRLPNGLGQRIGVFQRLPNRLGRRIGAFQRLPNRLGRRIGAIQRLRNTFDQQMDAFRSGDQRWVRRRAAPSPGEPTISCGAPR